MINHIRIVPLLTGLVIGIIAILCVKPEETVIYKYPHPDIADKTIYKDKNGVCYRYKATKVDCDKNQDKLKDFPLSK
jgi:hypothetical protein